MKDVFSAHQEVILHFSGLSYTKITDELDHVLINKAKSFIVGNGLSSRLECATSEVQVGKNITYSNSSKSPALPQVRYSFGPLYIRIPICCDKSLYENCAQLVSSNKVEWFVDFESLGVIARGICLIVVNIRPKRFKVEPSIQLIDLDLEHFPRHSKFVPATHIDDRRRLSLNHVNGPLPSNVFSLRLKKEQQSLDNISEESSPDRMDVPMLTEVPPNYPPNLQRSSYQDFKQRAILENQSEANQVDITQKKKSLLNFKKKSIKDAYPVNSQEIDALKDEVMRNYCKLAGIELPSDKKDYNKLIKIIFKEIEKQNK